MYEVTGLRRFDLILFDLGSTLLFFDTSWDLLIGESHRALWRALNRLGFPTDSEQFLTEFGHGMEDYYQYRSTALVETTTESVLRRSMARLGYVHLSAEVVRAALAALYSVSQAHWRVEDDAAPTLTVLKERGYRMGILSNAADSADVHKLVDDAGLRPFFEQVLISADIGLRKPHARPFELALSQFGVAADRAVMVGDTLGADILGANALGMASVWITRRMNSADHAAHSGDVHPDACISALSELPGLLDHWAETICPEAGNSVHG